MQIGWVSDITLIHIRHLAIRCTELSPTHHYRLNTLLIGKSRLTTQVLVSKQATAQASGLTNLTTQSFFCSSCFTVFLSSCRCRNLSTSLSSSWFSRCLSRTRLCFSVNFRCREIRESTWQIPPHVLDTWLSPSDDIIAETPILVMYMIDKCKPFQILTESPFRLLQTLSSP